MSNLSAKVAIWVSTNPRPEHVTAINYLNEVVPHDTSFYLLRLQAFRIGQSEPAPLFTVEAGPSEERAAGGDVKKELADRERVRYQFFDQLLAHVNKISNLFRSITPVGYQNWLGAGAGKAGTAWNLVVMRKTARTEFFLCHPDFEINKARFEKLMEHKEKIEQNFEEALSWDFNESRKQQYIRSSCPIGGLDNEEKWSDIHEDMTDRLVRLEKAIGPYINSL